MEPGTTATIVVVGLTLIIMTIFGGGLYMLIRFAFPMFDVDEDEPTMAELYTLTERFAKAQQDINDRTVNIVQNQQKLIAELKIRLDKLTEEK